MKKTFEFVLPTEEQEMRASAQSRDDAEDIAVDWRTRGSTRNHQNYCAVRKQQQSLGRT